MKTDIEIANEAKMLPIAEIASRLGILDDELEMYGKFKAKINPAAVKRLESKKNGKLILVTAVSPTPAGEGKTTTTIGLGQAMAKIGKNAIIALREPSLGPVFGVKGGAAGGGYSQVLPMDEINLHFTGDFHAITSANNLLSAMIDNHLMQGNILGINPKRIIFTRCLDMNDRALRNMVIGMGGKADGVVREEHFMITVASEIMAILCLATSLSDLKEKLGNILVAYTYDEKPIYCRDLNAQGAMCALLKDAIKPNLVQTIENTPCIIHGGPFANIAHGCNSAIATKTALKLADYCITEAGFGADLGAEKFLDIKCRKASLSPSAIVLVATVRALKYNGGVKKEDLKTENLEALKTGFSNLKAHIENLKTFGIPIVVAINHFYADTEDEISLVKDYCAELGVKAVVSKAFAEGGNGATELASEVCRACESDSILKFTYPDNFSIIQKIDALAKNIYRADGVDYTPAALSAIKNIEEMGYGNLPVCVAKTQYSISDNPLLLGCPLGYRLTVREVRVSAGAGFVVVLAGTIMTMPGLPKKPAAEGIDIDDNGIISGLF
ncbi:MAG: formate--tetrahydrofolate ligase [Clostridiales bacterium GWF2_36_10]|nr:MAG: formate--tetrahydrofolate ligase [Clostridiales bacterium GWF2_36_10]HAN21701.1 formate--tetrahydrofolate ligase [Clostridiales bacterium]